MKLNGPMLLIAFVVTLALYAIAYAITTDQIWQSVYISGSQSLRVIAAP